MPLRGEAALAARRHHPLPDLLLHDRALRHRHHQPGRKLGRRRHRGDARRRSSSGRLTWRHVPRDVAQDARHLVHVHVADPGGAGLRRGLRRHRRGAGDRDTCSSTNWELEPWQVLILMMVSLHHHGHVPRRHGHAGDRRAALHAAGEGSLGYDLVWFGVLYTITCQIAYITPPFGYNLFLMRSHGAEGDHAGRHLPVHHGRSFS